MNSMREPLNIDHHHLTGNKLTSTHHTALTMASSLQPLQRSVDAKHRLEVHTVSDTSSPESVGKSSTGRGRLHSYSCGCLLASNQGLVRLISTHGVLHACN